MSRLDDLPPDQHATLSLLLSQRKSYAEVATMLSISERAVHDRAHAALAVLAPRQARELTADRRDELSDYLLGQQTSVAGRLATRTYLDGSAPARSWAHAISAEIAPLSPAPLPEIPSGAASPTPDVREVPREPQPSRIGTGGLGGVGGGYPRPSSRLGGALLLAAIAAAIIVAVVLIAGTSSGGGSRSGTTAASSTSAGKAPTTSQPSRTSKPTTTAGGPKEDARLILTSPDPTSKATGAVEILSEGSQHAYYLAADHLTPSRGFFYAVWLYNSPSSHEALNKSPAVGSNGKLQGGSLLPANAGQYHQILLTRETTERPGHPGPIVLRGTFSLGH
jgi:hypothetical protein